MLCSRIPLPESIVLATTAKLEFYLSAGKKKRGGVEGGTEHGDMLFISHTTNFLSHLPQFPLFESELGNNLQDLERLVHTVSHDTSQFLFFFFKCYFSFFGRSLTF